MKKFTKVAAAAGAALLIAVLPSMPAFADQGAAIIGSQAYYTTGNDQLSAWDTQADGASAIAEIRASAGSTIYGVTESRGQGYVAYRTVSMPANYQIRACIQDFSAGTPKSCGPWVNGS
ncbi:MAG: hypothetical protein DI534_09150 [Leifsonia xyli]|nr:MAG: hypothetical protein DI534_09150 [Leifsonia xyli]